MRNRYIKKVINTKNQVIYYSGDGIFFGRISKKEAEDGLASGKYTIWESVSYRAENILEFKIN